MPQSPSPEYQLILLGALYPLQSAQAEQLRALCRLPAIEWPAVIKLAQRHGLGPLLYANLSQHAATLVPAKPLQVLKKIAQHNSSQALGLLSELDRLAALLAQKKIPVCPLKGPLLSKQIYGEPGLRSTGDLDLLVAEEHLDLADELLRQADYQRTVPAEPLSPAQWRVYKKMKYHTAYEQAARHTRVELHWALSTPEQIPPEATRQYLARAHPLPSNPALLILSNEDLLCYLILHGSRHGWESLKWLADVAMILSRSPGLDWEQVSHQMAGVDMLLPLGQSLLLARDLFGASVPPSLEPLLHQRSVQRLADAGMKIIFSDYHFRASPGLSRTWKEFLYRVHLKKSWKYKIALLLQIWPKAGLWLNRANPSRLHDR